MAINSLSAASKGFSGLASGMDTQKLVESMLSGTQAKIDKQKEKKVLLEYKRDIYRDVLNSFKALQNNFLKFGSKTSTNLLSSGFYNTMTAVTESKALRVTAGSSAAVGKVTVNSIEQLAQSLKYTAKQTASGEVKGKLDLDAINRLTEQAELQVQLDGVTKTIKLPMKTGADLTAAEVKEQLQQSLTRAFGDAITVSVDGNNAIAFGAAHNSREFIIGGNSQAMQLFGMRSGISNKINVNHALENINFKTPLQGSEFAFTINGVSFSFDQSESMSSMISTINASNAGVKIRYSELTDKFSIESTVSGAGSEIKISQESGNLLTAMFGLQGSSGISGKTLYETVSMVADAAPNEGLESEMNRYVKSGGAFSLMVDGQKVSVTLPKPGELDAPLTQADVIVAINQKLADEGLGGKVMLQIDESGDDAGKVRVLTLNSETRVSTGEGFNTLGFQSAKTNTRRATDESSLEQLGLNGTTIKIGENTLALGEEGAPKTVAELVARLNTAMGTNGADSGAKFDENLGKITIFGVKIPMDIMIEGDGGKLFGAEAIHLEESNGSAMTGGVDITEGKNAVLYINNERVERSSNQFTVEGISYELLEETNAAQTINVSRDTEQISSGIEKFMEEYNSLVEKVWTLIKEDPTYKKYPPLTDAQRSEMTDKEIELWEKKSKEGLLRGDDTLELIMNNLRSLLTAKPAGAKYSLYDLGISTGYDIEKGFGGVLKFTNAADPTAKLKELLATEPHEVEKIFSDASSGLAVSLNKMMDQVTRYYEPGHESARFSLASLAGLSGLPDTSSKIYTQIRDIDKNLENLTRKYEAEYNRHWKQFNAMEKMIQSMNQQSAWLMSQFGG